jgi:hypothetical protein
MRGRTIRTLKNRREFLTKLRESCSVEMACAAIGFARSAAYRWRDADAEFRNEWDATIQNFLDHEVEAVRATLIERAKAGDTVAAIFLLRHHLPQIYNPNLLLRREALKLEIEQRRRALADTQPTVDAVRHVVIDGQDVPVVNNVLFALPPNGRDQRDAALIEEASDGDMAALVEWLARYGEPRRRKAYRLRLTSLTYSWRRVCMTA